MKPYLEAKTTKELCKLLGLPTSDSTRVEIRRDLVIAIRKVVESEGYTHVRAAKLAGVGRTVITGIVNGNIEKISTDRLIDVATHLGITLQLKVA